MKPVAAVLSLAMVAAAYVPRTDFSVIITIYFKGTRPLWTYRLTTGSITVTRHYTDGTPDSPVLERALTPKEIRALDRYFTGFNPGGLKHHYTDESIDGDSCSRYYFSINRSDRESYVCYARPPELAGLNRMINDLLPRRYRLWSGE
jgi:hypothetical protein